MEGQAASSPAQPPLPRNDALELARRSLKVVTEAPFGKINSFTEYQRDADDRKSRCPDFDKAAILWPSFANEFWTELQDQILELFRPNPSPSFEHWILAYCKHLWPQIFGSKASSHTSLLGLVNTLSHRHFRTLHVAAALGLSKLCDRLVCDGSDPSQDSPMGTPLYCALVGPRAFLAKPADALELAREPWPSFAQADTLRVFVDSESIPCLAAITSRSSRPYYDSDDENDGYDYDDFDDHGEINDKELFSLPLMAFLTCLRLRVPDLYRRMRLFLGFDERCKQLIKNGAFSDLTWVRGRGAKAFLEEILPAVFDDHLLRFTDDIEASMFLDSLWRLMQQWNLGVTLLREYQRVPRITDRHFPNVVRTAIRHDEPSVLRRLMRDPRWNPAIRVSEPNPGDAEEAWSTVFHSLVEEDRLCLCQDILSFDADVHLRDSEERTPLMLAESIDMARLLIAHGAKTTETDSDGRNIWHFAAANNDIALLKFLLNEDEFKDTNLRASMWNGRTPVAQAMIYPLLQLKDIAFDEITPAIVIANHKRGAHLLLEACRGHPEYLGQPDVPLAHVIAMWGDERMLKALKLAGGNFGELDELDRCALDWVNLGATADFIRALRAQCPERSGLARNKNDFAPAVSIFHSHKDGLSGCLERTLTAHPAVKFSLDPEAYMELIGRGKEYDGGPEEGETGVRGTDPLRARDSTDRLIWEAFFVQVVFGFMEEEHIADAGAVKGLQQSILRGLHCLIQRGALEAYEQEEDLSGINPLLNHLALGPAVPEPWLSTVGEAMMLVARNMRRNPEELLSTSIRLFVLVTAVVDSPTDEHLAGVLGALFSQGLLPFPERIDDDDDDIDDIDEGGSGGQGTRTVELLCTMPYSEKIWLPLMDSAPDSQVNEELLESIRGYVNWELPLPPGVELADVEATWNAHMPEKREYVERRLQKRKGSGVAG